MEAPRIAAAPPRSHNTAPFGPREFRT